MDVVCENCRTVYEFDESQITEQGVTVKCTNCTFLFRVQRRTATAGPPPTPSGPPTVPNVSTMVRTPEGEVYRISEMSTLQQWIVERKVTRDYDISRDGTTWNKLSEISELAPFFDIVQKAVSNEASTPVEPTVPKGWGVHDGARRPPSGPTSEGPTRRGSGGLEKPTGRRDQGAITAEWEAHEDLSSVRSRRTPAWLPLAIAALVGAALFVIAGVKFLPRLRGDGNSTEYRAARLNFLRGTESSLATSKTGFEAIKDGKDAAQALAGLSSVCAADAQLALDQAEIAERGGDEDSAERLKSAAIPHANAAKELAAKALQQNGDSLDANRAMGDALRLLGGAPSEVEGYVRRALQSNPNDPETLLVEGALRMDQDKAVLARELLSRASRLFQKKEKQAFLSADVRLAVLELRAGNDDAARQQLQRVIAAEKEHRNAAVFLAFLTSGQHPEKVEPTAPPPAEADPKQKEDKASRNDDKRRTARKSDDDDSAPITGGTYDSLIREGDRLSEQGRTDRATKLYRRALALKPTGVEALTGLGYCAMDNGDNSEALARFRDALTFNRKFGDALIGMAEIYKLEGNPRKAREHYQRYVDAHPSGRRAAMAQQNIKEITADLGDDGELGEPAAPPSERPPGEAPTEGEIKEPPPAEETNEEVPEEVHFAPPTELNLPPLPSN